TRRHAPARGPAPPAAGDRARCAPPARGCPVRARARRPAWSAPQPLPRRIRVLGRRAGRASDPFPSRPFTSLHARRPARRIELVGPHRVASHGARCGPSGRPPFHTSDLRAGRAEITLAGRENVLPPKAVGCRRAPRGGTPTMTTRWLTFIMIGSALLVTGGARDAHAGDMCVASCSTARRVCLAEAKTALKACAAACTGDADRTACKQTCRDALAQAKDACRSALDECHADCPPPPPNPASCSFACATTARSCFGGVLENGKACAQACRGSSGDDL